MFLLLFSIFFTCIDFIKDPCYDQKAISKYFSVLMTSNGIGSLDVTKHIFKFLFSTLGGCFIDLADKFQMTDFLNEKVTNIIRKITHN